MYARYLCSRDALGLKAAAGRPSAARDDRVSCIQGSPIKLKLVNMKYFLSDQLTLKTSFKCELQVGEYGPNKNQI